MILSDISELMALSVGMNFALIVTSFIPNSNISYYLKMYSDNSKKRVTLHSIKSILVFQETRDSIDYSLTLNAENPGRYDVLLATILVEEEKIRNLVYRFLKNSKSCLDLAYLPHISLILGLYALIVMGLAPFHINHKLLIEHSLLMFNTFTLLAIIFTIILENIKPVAIGFKHYFYYFILSMILLIICFFNAHNRIFDLKIISSIVPISIISVIIIPFLGIIYYLLKAFFINEYQVSAFILSVIRLKHKRKNKMLMEMVNNFELKDTEQLSEEISVSIRNES